MGRRRLLLCSLPVASLSALLVWYVAPRAGLGDEAVDCAHAECARFDFDFSSIRPVRHVEEPVRSVALEVLPGDYDSVVAALGDPGRHGRTSLLAAGVCLIAAEGIGSVAEGYEYLDRHSLGLLVPREYVAQYFAAEMLDIARDLGRQAATPAERRALNCILRDITRLEECRAFADDGCLDAARGRHARHDHYLPAPIPVDWLLPSNAGEDDGIEGFIGARLERSFFLEKAGAPGGIVPSSAVHVEVDEGMVNGIAHTLDHLEAVHHQLGGGCASVESRMARNREHLSSLGKGDAGEFHGCLLGRLNYGSDELAWLVRAVDGQSLRVAPMAVAGGFDHGVEEDNFVPDGRQPKDTVRVPVLMYHQIADVPAFGSEFLRGFFVSGPALERQLAWLVRNNYRTVTPEELYELLERGTNPTQKSVMLTFDDGTEGHYTTAFPLLERYGLTGVFYVISGGRRISHRQLKEMAGSGMVIDSHTRTHRNLRHLERRKDLLGEIAGSRRALRRITGREVYSIAYPFCAADGRAIRAAASSGYLIGVSCNKGMDHRYRDRLSLERIPVRDDMESFLRAVGAVDSI